MFLLAAINTKYIHSNPSVYSLKAYANKVHNTGDSIQIAEYTINQLKEDIIADISLKPERNMRWKTIEGGKDGEDKCGVNNLSYYSGTDRMRTC